MENLWLVQRATLPNAESRRSAAFLLLPRSQAATLHGAVAPTEKPHRVRLAFGRMNVRRPLKRETRPGGQPDGSSYKGRLGVDGRSRRIQPRWGGISAPTDIGRRRAIERSKRPSNFFNFFGELLGRKSRRGGPISVVNRRLIRGQTLGGDAGGGRIQIPGRRNLLTVRDFFGGGLA